MSLYFIIEECTYEVEADSAEAAEELHLEGNSSFTGVPSRSIVEVLA